MSGLTVLLPFLFAALILGLFGGLFFYKRQKEKERTRQMQLAAGQLGWSFIPEAAWDRLPSTTATLQSA